MPRMRGRVGRTVARLLAPPSEDDAPAGHRRPVEPLPSAAQLLDEEPEADAPAAVHRDEEPGHADEHDEHDEPGLIGQLVRRHPITSAVVVMLAVMAAWRASIYSGSWFGADDFVYQSRAHRLGLSWTLLDYNYQGQYMPGGFLLAALDERLAPLNWHLVVVEVVLLQVLAGWTFWRLLVTAFGASRLLLVPFGLYLLTPVTVPAANWWSASLNSLPLLVVTPLAMTSALLLLRTGRPRHAVAAALWTAVGLLFFVKALLLVAVLPLLVLALRHTTGERLSRAAVVRRCGLLWLLLVPVVVGYGLLYFSAPKYAVSGDLQVPGSISSLLSLYEVGLGHVLAPGLVGGPWRWVGTDAPTALSNVAFAPMLLSWIAVGATVLLACRVRRRGASVWLVLLVWACGDLAFVAVGRLNLLNSFLALESHYLADAMPLAWFAVAYSFLPVQGEPGRPLRWERLHLPQSVLRYRAAAAVVVASLVAVSSLTSVHAFSQDRHSRQDARTYVETAARELKAAPPDLTLYDRDVPPSLLNGLFASEARTSKVLAPVIPDRFGPRLFPVYAEHPYVFDDRGHLRTAKVGGVQLQTGPDRGCGWSVHGGPRTLPWASRVFDFSWALRIGYLASEDTDVSVAFGRSSRLLHLHRGLGQVIVPVEGAGDGMTLTVGGTATVCVGDAQIGNVEPS